jgi:hypothetical protein
MAGTKLAFGRSCKADAIARSRRQLLKGDAIPPRAHLLATSRAARLAERALHALWRSGLEAPPQLDPHFLWTVASRGFTTVDETSCRSEGDIADFRLRLDRICQSLNGEAQLNALGTVMAYGQLNAAIRARHALGRLWRARPHLAATPIAPPLIVVGQMRSGSTRVHRLLAAVPAHCGAPLFRALAPVPQLPGLRPVKAALCLAAARAINPWLDTLHPFGVLRTDEELAWLSHALLPAALEAQYAIPAYVAFSEARDTGAAYREFARVLRTDAALSGTAARPRVVKCPQFAEDLPSLLDQFPDARVVVVRRDMDEVLASTVSLVASQAAFQSNAADVAAIESTWRRKIALRDKRIVDSLARFAGPVAELAFSDLEEDWERAITRTYRQLAIALTPAALAAMCQDQRAARNSPHHAHGRMMRHMARG